jgi:hypothetical protein
VGTFLTIKCGALEFPGLDATIIRGDICSDSPDFQTDLAPLSSSACHTLSTCSSPESGHGPSKPKAMRIRLDQDESTEVI